MNPDDMPINSTRDDKPSVDYSVLCRLDKIASKLIAVEAKLDTLLAKKKPKPRASKQVKYPTEFEDVWAAYPKRVGSNPKKKALSAWFARGDAATFTDGDPEENEMAERFGMLMGVVAYCQFCDATVEDKRFVMQASTFLGPEQHYRADWTIPKKKATEDPDKQHHATFDPSAEVVIPEGQNPYENM